PSTVIFHDAKWKKTNEWFAEVSGYVDHAIAAQHLFLPSIEEWASGKTACRWKYFPMPDLTPPAIQQKDEYGVIITQWIQWKRHKDLVPMLPNVRLPMMMFGDGIEYHNIAANSE